MIWPRAKSRAGSYGDGTGVEAMPDSLPPRSYAGSYTGPALSEFMPWAYDSRSDRLIKTCSIWEMAGSFVSEK